MSSLGRCVRHIGSQDRTRTYTDGVKVRCASLHHSTVSTHLLTQQSHIDRAVQRLVGGERLWRWQALANPACVAITFSALTGNGANRRKASLRKRTFGRSSKCTRVWANWWKDEESNPKLRTIPPILCGACQRNTRFASVRHSVESMRLCAV